MVVISLKEANRQRCRPGRRRNARQGHTCASLAPQNRPKGPRLLAPRTTSDIRGEIVPGDGASLVSLFLDSLSLPTSPLATTMVSSLLSVLVVVSHTCPILSLTMGEPRGGTWLVPCRPGVCRYGRPTHINSTALILHSPLPLAPAPIPSCNSTPCTCSARREGQVYGSHGALEGALPGCHGALPVIDGAIP